MTTKSMPSWPALHATLPADGASRDLWEVLVDARMDSWDARDSSPDESPRVKTLLRDALETNLNVAEAVARYENPVFKVTRTMGVEGELYHAAVAAGVIPAGITGLQALRDACQGSAPLASAHVMNFLTQWWHDRCVPEAARR